MLRIRPYKTTDAASIQNWIKNPREHALWCANLMDYPITDERMAAMHAEYNAQGEGGLFTGLNASGTPVGFFAVMRADYKINNAHLGFIIIDPAQRGQGYGKEIVHMAVRYCFYMLFTTSVTLKVYDMNEIAYRCYQTVGFKNVTHNDRSLVFEGESWGTQDMIIIKKGYKVKGEFK